MAAVLSSKKVDCKDLHSYLKTLSPGVLDRLYTHPATCLAVFRELPELSKHYVMRMLFVEQPVSQQVVGLWVGTKHQEEHRSSSQVLTDLRVWHEQAIAGGLPGWTLNSIFRQNMKVALLGGGSPWTGGGGNLPVDKYAKDISFLDKYATERWECVLHFMVGSSEGSDGVSKDIIDVLLNSGLMKNEPNEPYPSITQMGFQFLLMDVASQIWYFMLQYLETVEARGMDLIECLSFLFQLSFSTLGKDYSTDGMSESQLRFLQHLREFGLVYQRKRKSQRYYPTRSAINLASGLSSNKSETSTSGYLVVETNYRVYAYTVGNISRISVRDALTRGISAEQKSRSPKDTPVIPPTVTDQIRLWELEYDRFRFNEGVLYSQFLSQTDFELLRDYARDLGVLIWDSPAKRVMVVSRGGHDDVIGWFKLNHKHDLPDANERNMYIRVTYEDSYI
ncbi:hypothetical protein KUTeg_021752 [Tegillarca granosa]|uniref:General transcription factor IIH subunit 4 n=1 Tax=Tegillarca granosa TaxID=220873 RepID=A0ABQ9E499_TEGGR|nr:hypothetical protein KUTeg_021752 [Tegillarca granosa]